MMTAGPRNIRTRFLAWCVVAAGMLAFFLTAVLPRLNIDTDILALLPRSGDAAVENAVARLGASLSARQLFLVGAADADRARRAAERFAATLTASGEFANVQLQVRGDLKTLAGIYRGQWPSLLGDADRERLKSGDVTSLQQDALRAAYTPAGMIRVLPLAQDPLGLTGNFLLQQLPSVGHARLDGGVLMVSHEGREFVLVTTATKASVFAEEVQQRVLPVIDAAVAAARQTDADISIVSSGAIRHAAAATRQAKAEISLFGTINAFAAIALLYFVFGSIRPLVLGALVLGFSIVGAITASHLIFGKVHVMALVFGASLIGVVIDYSMHFLADRFRLREEWTAERALAHVAPAIVLGMSTTMVGYLGLLLMPFPGLRQIAAFCMVGIAVGCASVLILYPFLMSYPIFIGPAALPERGPRLAKRIDAWLLRWKWTSVGGVALAAVLFAAIGGVLQLRVEDDIRALQSSPQELVAEERRVQELLGGGVESRFILVQASDAQAVLEKEESLRPVLDSAIREGQLSSYLAVSRAVPSMRRQAEDRDLLARHVYAAGGAMPKFLSQLGFGADKIEARLAEFRASTPLTIDTWLASESAGALHQLWLGEVGSSHATVVSLTGIRDPAALRALTEAVPGVRFVDRPQEVSAVMGLYRVMTTWLLLFANAAALTILSWRFGWRDGLRLAMPSAAACLVTLGLFGWLGVGVNLFNVFALLLVLALGVDYGIFLRHGQNARVTAILSVTLSAGTTLIGFGMLAFSATPFIRSIGATLLCGIVCSWIFVLLSCMTVAPTVPEGKS